MIPFRDNVRITGDLTVDGSITGATRSSIETEYSTKFPIPLESLRVWDAYQTPLGGTPSSDDLGIATGTFATGLPYVSSGDLKATASTTRYARALFTLPVEYVAGGAVSINFSAGMKTTVSDTTAKVDVEVYKSNRDTTKTGSDLVSTSEQSINSLTFSDKEFVLSPASLEPGDVLDIRFSITISDGATGTAVIGAIAHPEVWLSVQG